MNAQPAGPANPAHVTAPLAPEQQPESERRPASRTAPEAIFWHGLITGAFRLVEASYQDSCYLAIAREQGIAASKLTNLELILLHRVFQGVPQKNLAFEFDVSAATISQLLGGARLKLGLGDRMSSTPLPIVLLALKQSGATSLPSARFARFQRAGQEHLELGLSPLEPEALDELSGGERHVALLFAWGATYRQIADQRGTSPRTVSNQLANICTKLRVHGRFELIRCWAERQWGTPRANAQ